MTTTIPTARSSSCAEDYGVTVREHYVLSSRVDICVLTVQGEIDLMTLPLLDATVRELCAAVPATTNLIVDVAQVTFLSGAGLRWLLDVPDLEPLKGSRIHLSGMSNRVVARPLKLITFGDPPRARSALVAPPLHSDLAHALNSLTA